MGKRISVRLHLGLKIIQSLKLFKVVYFSVQELKFRMSTVVKVIQIIINNAVQLMLFNLSSAK